MSGLKTLRIKSSPHWCRVRCEDITFQFRQNRRRLCWDYRMMSKFKKFDQNSYWTDVSASRIVIFHRCLSHLQGMGFRTTFGQGRHSTKSSSSGLILWFSPRTRPASSDLANLRISILMELVRIEICVFAERRTRLYRRNAGSSWLIMDPGRRIDCMVNLTSCKGLAGL